ncbi:hypothetical protein RFI_20270 [Reticulomyxa filosa]|uniref:Uncharacterized protein n=1 Tax=Reticulomyxa filosa TaxID=46433 RepID=X6MSV5_RETFI|nr:hypothetical protein RFI_20270 [Reticulomyxa filosa]|eukprot:ETO17063.1 hypothetical protein RFI_20270 [Reticulomyxa filosa]
MGMHLYKRRFSSINIEVERTVKVLEMRTPLAEVLRNIVKEYEPNHWTLTKYEELRKKRDEQDRIEMQKRKNSLRNQFRKWMNPNLSEEEMLSTEEGYGRQWLKARWDSEYIPPNPDIRLTPEMKQRMRKLNQQQSHSNKISDLNSNGHETGTFIPEYPLPKEDDHKKNETNVPSGLEYAWRPGGRTIPPEWYPERLTTTMDNNNQSDKMWMNAFGVDDEETQNTVLSPPPAEIDIEQCWRVEDEYRRCTKKYTAWKERQDKCQDLRRNIIKCRTHHRVQKMKGL